MATRPSTRLAARVSQIPADRPPLPLAKYNTLLRSSVEGSELPPVKFQPIKKEGHTIIVGRVKVPTPSGHAYVLRRYDTGSISLTTMWKAAFPSASTSAEKEETNWIKKNYDISGPPETIRLAGTWLPVNIALQLSSEYKLTKTVEGLSKAEPDVSTILRAHDGTGQEPTNTAPPLNIATPNKRRKASPQTAEKKPVSSSSRTTRSSLDPASAAAAGSPRISGRQLRSRTKSPAAVARTTPSRAVKSKIMTPPAEDATSDAEVELPSVDPEQDIAESKALVDKLKAELNGGGSKSSTPSRTLPKRGAAVTAKRAREEVVEVLPNGDPVVKLDLEATPTDPSVTREIASNSRVREVAKWRPAMPSWPSVPQLEPRQKSAAWGTLAFALAVGATALAPQFF